MSNTSEFRTTEISRRTRNPARSGSESETRFAISRDGTKIAYSGQGTGPALILVDGALCHRSMGPSAALAKALRADFTVFTYDRRGRGESGDTAPYSLEREVEDIDALVKAAGGSAFLWGMSSGALLAVSAAARLDGIRKLVTYEAPLIVDGSRGTTETDWQNVRRAVAAGRRSDAVRGFLAAVGVPRPAMFVMGLLPVWRKLKAVAHTLPYDGAIVENSQRGRPLGAGPWQAVGVPTLVTDGGASPEWMRAGNRALATAIPNAGYRTLPDQSHMLNSKAYAPVLLNFFRS